MKKRIQKASLLLLALLLLNVQVYAAPLSPSNNNDDVSTIVNFDESEIYEIFVPIENNYEKNPYVILTSSLPISTEDSNKPLTAFGVPSFLWGCVGTIPGIILVMVVTDDYSEAKKAFSGCVATYLAAAMLYVYIAVLSSEGV